MYNNGFTLLEMMLSVALLALIGGLSVPLYQSFQDRNRLRVASHAVTQTIRRAHTLARATSGDSSWGVYIQPGSVTLFRGDDFSSRDNGFDEQMDIAGSIKVSGRREYVFTKLSGTLRSAGVTTMTGPNENTRDVSVNQAGMVNY